MRMIRLDAGRLGVLALSLATAGLLAFGIYFFYDRAKVHGVTIAAGSSSGESYILSQALKAVVERHHPKVKLTILETGGTAENLRLLESRAAALAAAQADVPAGPAARAVAVLYEDTFQLLARDAAPIQSFPDLRGKRIGLPQTGGQYRSFLSIAEHFGMVEQDFRFVGADDLAADNALLKGEADAVFRVRALGNPSISRLVSTGNVRFVRINQAAAMKIKLPALVPSVIPEGAYLGNPPIPATDLPAVAVERTLLAHRSADPDVIRAITETLMELRQEIAHAIPDDFAEVRPLLAGVKEPETRTGLGAALHDGAQLHYDRDKPSFINAHADFFALILTVIVLLGSWIWEVKRWIERRQKNRADEYNHEVVLLINRVQSTGDWGQLEQIRLQLLDALTEVVRALDEDRISEESFQSFRVVWQIALDMIRERRTLLGLEPAEPRTSRTTA